MNYNMKQSGERIRQLRLKSELTQEQIAGKLNIDRSFYGRVEAGRSGCSVDLLIQLSELFEVSLDYLILGRYSMTTFKDKEKLLLKEDIDKVINLLGRIKEIF